MKNSYITILPGWVVFCILLLGLTAPQQLLAAASASKDAAVENNHHEPIVRVNVTHQQYDFIRPWNKENPGTRSGIAAILPDNRLLVSAELVANHSFIELEKPDGGEKEAASVVAVDYSANLALLAPQDPEFLADFSTFEMTDKAQIGDRLEAWQLEPNGSILKTEALLTSVQLQPYPQRDIMLLLYQLTSALQSRDGSFTIPLTKQGKLAGVVMRYNSRAQNMGAIPIDVIRHFLKDVDDGDYAGFPKAGLIYSPTRDPQLRKYVALDDEQGGVYINEVQANRAGAKAGVREGDILLAIDGQAIDRDGNYQDPDYGKLALANLISLHAQAGDSLALKLLRDDKEITVDMVLETQPPESYVSPPYVIDEAPSFLIAGGLVFLELSRQYLKGWGNSWSQQANAKLVYYDRYQSMLFEENNRRIVFLSQVLPTQPMLGYKGLKDLVVTKVNDRQINSLVDLKSALEMPDRKFHKIEFEDAPRMIFLDATEMQRTNDELLTTYGLPATERLP